MTIFKQMAGAVLATSLLFATSATALPTTEVSCEAPLDSISANASQDIGLPPANVTCNPSSGLVFVDVGNVMMKKASDFCNRLDGKMVAKHKGHVEVLYSHLGKYSYDMAGSCTLENQNCQALR